MSLRVEERQITLQDLRRLQEWVNAGPWAPDGDWYKDFGSFILCGSGEFPKTVLARGMAPFGTGIEEELRRVGDVGQGLPLPRNRGSSGITGPLELSGTSRDRSRRKWRTPIGPNSLAMLE
jgi:hypothetical protein